MRDSGSTSGAAAKSPKSSQDQWRIPRALLVCCAIGILVIFVGSLIGPATIDIVNAGESYRSQTARALGIAMYAYANDHNQHYPEGNSSTEVFQKLIDGGYVTDPTIFYFPLAGKTKAVPRQKLKPENVCWDVTSGADSSSPDGLPLFFMTGYKVTYAPGGAAVPIIRPRTSIPWWSSITMSDDGYRAGIAIFYKGNISKFMSLGNKSNPDGTIPNFVSPDFKPDGKTYRQLTPDGPVP